MNTIATDPLKKNSKRYVLAITFVATLGGLLFGYDTGVISGSQLYFTEYFSFTEVEQGWAVSSALYGCLFGAASAGFINSKFSRKNALIFSAILFAISAWGSGIPESLTELVIYRIIGGIGVGIASMTSPIYIAEIAPPADRGRLVSYYQLAVVIGFFVVFLSTYFIGGGNTVGLTPEDVKQIHDYNVGQGWRVMFQSELIPAGMFLILLLFVPRSPRWLIMNGKMEDAKNVLLKITGSEIEASKEFADIKLSMVERSAQAKVSVFQKKYMAMLIIGTALSILQQITGINAILYYGAEIFSKALGYGPEDALKQQILLATVNMLATFIAIYFVDRVGRKPLLIWGTSGMFIGLSILSITVYFNYLGVLSLIGILTFIGSFAFSMGPITWVLLSEIFPNVVRSQAMSIAVAAQWLFNAIVANSFPLLMGSELNHSVFNGILPYFIFAFFCMVTIIFAWKWIPETKGRSLEEMEELWEKK